MNFGANSRKNEIISLGHDATKEIAYRMTRDAQRPVS